MCEFTHSWQLLLVFECLLPCVNFSGTRGIKNKMMGIRVSKCGDSRAREAGRRAAIFSTKAGAESGVTSGAVLEGIELLSWTHGRDGRGAEGEIRAWQVRIFE